MPAFATVLAQRESRVLIHTRRTIIAVACIYAMLALWSTFRRLRQILYIEARASGLVLTPGSALGFDVVASGEVQNRLRLELLQGERSEILLEQRASVNRVSALDPRVFRYRPTVIVTPALLARFHAGTATIRVTGFGGQKLLHTPAARVRELKVELKP